MAPSDDYPDLDLGALDFGEDGPIEPVNTPDPDGDMGSLDLDFVDDSPSVSAPARFTAPASIELPPPSDPGEDDFGGLLDAGDDDFQDLLGGDEPAPPSGPDEPAPAESIDEHATPRPGEFGADAADETDFGGLLVGPRLSNPTAPTPIVGIVGNASLRSPAETPVRGVPSVGGLTGAPTPQPLADDFGDLGPMDLPDDDFSDLLNDDAQPAARPAARAPISDEFDFGDLALGDDASVHEASVRDAHRTPAPGPLPVPAATPVPAAPTPRQEAETPQPEALPPIADVAAFDEATAFNFGDLLPDDLQGALDAAAAADAAAFETDGSPSESADASAVDLEPPATSREAAPDLDASVEADLDFDFDLGLDEPKAPAEEPEASAEAPAVSAVEPAASDEADEPSPAGFDFGDEISVELDAPEVGDLHFALSDAPADDPETPAAETPAAETPAAETAAAETPTPDEPAAGPPAPADDAFFAQFDDLGDEPVDVAPARIERETPPVPEDASFDAEAFTEARAFAEPPEDPEVPQTDQSAESDLFGAADGVDLDFDEPAAASRDADPEIEEPAPDFAPETPAVHEALLGLNINEPPPGPPAATSDVAAALSDLLGPSLSVGTPPTPAVAHAIADLAGGDDDEDEDADRTVFAQPDALTGTASATANPRISEPPVSVRPLPSHPIAFAPEDDERGVDVEMEVASLPGVDMGLSAADALEPIEELDDIELLDDDLDMIEDDEGLEAEPSADVVPEGAGFDFDEPAPARRPMIDSRTVVASVTVADIEEELAEVDFLIESSLAADAREALEDLASEHGIGHPAIQARLARIIEIETLTRDAENAVSFMAATEPTPVSPLAGASVEDLNEADVAAHFDLGVAYMEMGQYKKAIAQLQKVADHRERRAEALRVIACANSSRATPRRPSSRSKRPSPCRACSVMAAWACSTTWPRPTRPSATESPRGPSSSPSSNSAPATSSTRANGSLASLDKPWPVSWLKRADQCGINSAGRVSASQAECRRFEPGIPLPETP
jgi:hypothetical protein